MKALLTRPGMEDIHGCWIEDLGAWIAEDEDEAETIREAMGNEAKIILGRDLK